MVHSEITLVKLIRKVRRAKLSGKWQAVMVLLSKPADPLAGTRFLRADTAEGRAELRGLWEQGWRMEQFVRVRRWANTLEGAIEALKKRGGIS